MEQLIRPLTNKDSLYVKIMDTGIEDDYIIRIFDRLVTGNNHMYGLFLDDQLVSVGGISVFANQYAMLGRLRSDRRFSGKSLATTLMAHMMKEAFHIDGVRWVGANTQENNLAARRVMEKIGLTSYIPLYGAITKNVATLESGDKPWKPVVDVAKKRYWLDKMYGSLTSVFPYECYYSFPVSSALFQNQTIQQWAFYENEDKTRALITKLDHKKYHYLHTLYPWNDFTSQKGLWETIAREFKHLNKQTKEETYIWMDLSPHQKELLPTNHQFQLSSPWILYGIEKIKWQEQSAIDLSKNIK